MLPVQTCPPQDIEIRFPRKQREQLRNKATAGGEIILLLKTATLEKPTNEGMNRRERDLDTELRLRVVETGGGIELGSLPQQIIDDIRGDNPIVETEKITAELIDIRSGEEEKSTTNPSTTASDSGDTEVFDPEHKGAGRSQRSPSAASSSDKTAPTTAPRFCRACGTDLRPHDDPTYCPECGTKIQSGTHS